MASVTILSFGLLAFSILAAVRLSSLGGAFGWLFGFVGVVAGLAVLSTLLSLLLRSVSFRQQLSVPQVSRLVAIWGTLLSRLVKVTRLEEWFSLAFAGVVLVHLALVYVLGATRSSGDALYFSYVLAMFSGLTVMWHGTRSVVLTTHLRLERLAQDHEEVRCKLSPPTSLGAGPLVGAILLFTLAIAFVSFSF